MALGRQWIDIRTANWEPANVLANETAALFTMAAGEAVVFMLVRPVGLADGTTNSDIEIGDGTDPDGYVATAALDPEAAALDVYHEARGAFMQGLRAYTAPDTIDVTYAADTTPGVVKPKLYAVIGVINFDA